MFSLLFGLVRCNDTTAVEKETATDGVVIRSGTSFGMCMGYCLKDLEISGTQAKFTQKSHRDDTKYPARTCTRTLSSNLANEYNLTAQLNEFRKLPAVIGCPDCADGGAEYVEIQVSEVIHRVKFEHGKTIPGFDALVKGLRTQREAFTDCK
ncbi:MAG: hypothetical protein EAZ91_00560 [Cytophagales bacterium]|nr:MAG: hypothetical protein EAZ91_00560 [Cytophagales bacterium]